MIKSAKQYLSTSLSCISLLHSFPKHSLGSPFLVDLLFDPGISLFFLSITLIGNDDSSRSNRTSMFVFFHPFDPEKLPLHLNPSI